MSISGIGSKSALTVQALVDMRAQLTDLQRQLGTGKKSLSYAGLGLDRGLAVGLRARMTSIDGYRDAITNVGVRLSMAQTALGRISQLGNQVKGVTHISPFEIDASGQTTAQKNAQSQLDEILGLLNSQAGDRYLFAGRAVDKPAVETYARIIDGDVGRAGLKQMIAERNQADLGASGLGRLVLPPLPPAVPAQITGVGAALNPDASAVRTGSQDVSALVSVGGTLVVNGAPITINPGDNAAAIQTAINAQSGLTNVTASLNGLNQLVLTGANADTAVDIGAGSTGALLTELGLTVGTTNPTNLLTQSAVAAGQTLTVTVGPNPTLTITFGNGVGQVSTMAELNAALAPLAGGMASVNLANGNMTIAAGNATDAIAVGGTANGAMFGLPVLSAGPSTALTVSEDVAGSPFGFKLVGMTSTIPGAAVTPPAGAPPAMSIALPYNPVDGQTVQFTFSLPDGSTENLTLTASGTTPLGAKQFAIGATPAATAANLQAALTTELGKLARTSLSAASAITASRNFFDIGSGQPPLRVAGPPFDTATALVAGTTADTVFWYTGEMGTDPARGTAVARADDSISISYGMRANEQALRWTVEHVAVFATMTYSSSDPDAANRFAALNQRLGPLLDYPTNVQTIDNIQAEIAGAQTTLQSAKERHQQTDAMLANLLESIEGVSQEEVGAQVLALQTRLQASLQTTALLYRTSIIDYL